MQAAAEAAADAQAQAYAPYATQYPPLLNDEVTAEYAKRIAPR